MFRQQFLTPCRYRVPIFTQADIFCEVVNYFKSWLCTSKYDVVTMPNLSSPPCPLQSSSTSHLVDTTLVPPAVGRLLLVHTDIKALPCSTQGSGEILLHPAHRNIRARRCSGQGSTGLPAVIRF